jgi:hypothetical protein
MGEASGASADGRRDPQAVARDARHHRPHDGAGAVHGRVPRLGGANFWHVGVRSYEVAQAIMQPKPPLPVYICGESYSHGQGWAEGALETAETMLQQHFGLPEPPWKKAAEIAKDPTQAAAVTA